MTEITDEYGNVFIKIPKFYIKKEVSDASIKIYVSKTKYENYYLPYCFYDFANNKELNYVLVGKYEASISDDETKIESKTGKYLLMKKNMDETRNYAMANNNDHATGYQQMDIHIWDALQSLFYVEFNTFDSHSVMKGFTTGITPWQSVYKSLRNEDNTNYFYLNSTQIDEFRIGQYIDISVTQGAFDVVHNRKIISIDKSNNSLTFDGEPINIKTNMSISNSCYITGETDLISASSGSINNNTDGKYPMMYRGIENFYGNLWTILDGIIVDNKSTGGTIYYGKNAKNYQSYDLSFYNKVNGYNLKIINGNISKLGYDSSNPFVQLPIAVNSYNASLYKSVFMYNNATEKKGLLAGGRYHDGGGVTSYSLNTAYNYGDLCIGSRLIKKES